MKLTYFRGAEPNFGDQLNATMWDQLLPQDFLDDNEADLFLGIGSILWDDLPTKPIKHVMGSGYGGYTGAPNVKDGSWNVVWVRGPLTAAHLGLDPQLAITDAAVLVRTIQLPDPEPNLGAAFMPHFESVARGNWNEVCQLAGVTYLDPRADPVKLISQIRGASLVITEAMHGAIIADALRTPFVAVNPTYPSHRAKWDDWAQSVGIDLRRIDLPSSSLTDSYVKLTGLQGLGNRSRSITQSPLLSPVTTLMHHRAARMLQHIVKNVEPQQSSDATIERVTAQCLEALHNFVAVRLRSP